MTKIFTDKPNFPKRVLFVMMAITIGAGIIDLLFCPPAIFPDPAWGFQVMRSMQMGGGFNLIIGPNPADIAKNMPTFLSWWSPGQYLVPYAVKLLTGLNTGHAAVLVVTIGNLSGLIGFYQFFKKIGFSRSISALSVLFIFCQEAYWIPFAFYPGGEVLLFAFEGWFLYGCASFTRADWKLVLFVLLSGWVGFICKSSFMWIFGSGLLCLWVRLCLGNKNILTWIKKGIWLGVPAIISIATIYIFYLSKGQNPASSSAGFKLTAEAIGFPLASPLLAGLSIDDAFNGLIFHTDGAPYSHTTILLVLIPLVILSLILIALIIRQVKNDTYRLFLSTFYCMAFLFFSYSFLKQATISYEARHFRLIGLLFTPGLIYLVSISKRAYQIGFGVICAGIIFQSAKYIAFIPHANRSGAQGVTGISQPFIDQPSLNYLMALDKANTNAIFAFITPDIGLEIQHNRIITLNPYDEDTAEDLIPYNGHAGPIYLLLPVSYTANQTAIMFRYFPGYKSFTARRLTKGYTLYTAN